MRLAIATAAALAVLLQLATSAGVIAGVLGVTLGYLLADRLAKQRVKTVPALLLTALLPFVASGVAALIARYPLFLPPVVALLLSDFLSVVGAAFALAFIVHFLSERVPSAALFEPALVVTALISTVSNHRHHRIEHPRVLSDWAWSHDVDPGLLLSALGVAGAIVAIIMLLRSSRAREGVWLILLLGLLLLAIPSATQLPPTSPPSGQNNDPDKNDKSSGASGSRPPDPMAIVVLHDELPEDLDAIYLRQSVLSRLSGDRLVEGVAQDSDIVNRLPAVVSTSPQNPLFHRTVHTSVFLLAEHAALFGPAHPFELKPIVNPNPSRFVGAYDVFSSWLRMEAPRLAGRAGRNSQWAQEDLAHYLAAPKDTRYLSLSTQIVRDMDPRFVGDDVMAAVAIKRYLEKNGIYNGSKKTLVGDDPTASFLFGDLHGYCVHFAHAAALLFRSQGIASRVALGYAVQTRLRGAGSSILVLENQAHAWPEIFVDGVGWVTFDIHPERSDDPPTPLVDVELESMLGEMARKDPPKPKTAATMPIVSILVPVIALFLCSLGIKLWRRVRGSSPRLVYRSVLDELSDLGARRRLSETREAHAQRVSALCPSFTPLTYLFLRSALGREDDTTLAKARALARQARADLARTIPTSKRVLALLNPIGFWLTR